MTVTTHIQAMLVGVSFITACSTMTPVPDSSIKEFTSAVQTLSFQKERAEQSVRTARRDYPQEAQWLLAAEQKYGHAAALANALIDKLKFSLTIGKVDEGQLRPDIERVAEAVNDLNAFANTPPYTVRGAPVPMLLTSVGIDSIVSAVSTLAKVPQERQDKLVNDVKKELDAQRWRGWNEIRGGPERNKM
jgi:hypothetical protein